MFCLKSVIHVDRNRTDEPKVPDFLCHMIAFWMHEYGIKAVDFSLDEVSDDEK